MTRKLIVILAVMLFVGGAVTTLVLKQWERAGEENVTGQRGNSVGNIVNIGHVAYDGSWHYFSEPDLSSALHKIKANGENKQLIGNGEDSSSYINVVGDWIYYRNGADGIYKIKTNGKGREKIIGDSGVYVSVVDGWIYYVNYSDDDCIYKVCVDGTGRQKLNNEASTMLNVVEGWIYYTNGEYKGLHKMRTDGTGHILLSDDECKYINVVDDWIYYCNIVDGNTIYKVQTNGTVREKICDDESECLNVSDGWIYYSNKGDGRSLYKIRIDGTDRELLYDDTCVCIIVAGEWIYYQLQDLPEWRFPLTPMYRIRTDGTGHEQVDSTYTRERDSFE